MEPEKVKCAAEGCDHLILPATAARTGGLCMRCVSERKNAERQEYVRTHRRHVDPYAGRSDAVEIIREFHTPRKFDPLITYAAPPKSSDQLYGSLSVEQARKLVEIVLEESDSDRSKDIATALATFTDHDLSRLQSAWIEAGRFAPAVLFRHSPATVRDRIVEFLDACSGEGGIDLAVNDALSALAWIGDDGTRQKFAEWERRPQAWRRTVYVGPNGYARTAGWELRDDSRHDLYHRECWAIEHDPADAAETASVTTFATAAGSCPWCRRPLSHLVEIDRRDARFDFLEVRAPKVGVLTCEVCMYFAEHIFARIDEAGRTRWHEGNVRPKHLPDENTAWSPNPWRQHACKLVRRHERHGIEESLVDGSQVGGLPGWVQDAGYPTCPDCGETMRFIAQLDNSRFKYHEGVHYAFLCAHCRVTATGYQQT